MYVYNRGRNRPVSHERFQSEQVGSVFIMVGGKSMAECVTGKTVLPSEFFFVCKDKAGDTLVIDGSVRFFFCGKSQSFGREPAGNEYQYRRMSSQTLSERGT